MDTVYFLDGKLVPEELVEQYANDGRIQVPVEAAIATDIDRSDTEWTPVGADRFEYPEAAVEAFPAFSQTRKCTVVGDQYCEGICLTCGSTDVDLAKAVCDKCGGPVPLVHALNTPLGWRRVYERMEQLQDPVERAKEFQRLFSTWKDKEPML